LNSNKKDADQIVQFYRLIREYQAEMSRSADGEVSHINNFGYWLPACRNLFDAEMALFDLIIGMLSPLEEGMKGVDIGCGLGGYAVRLLERYPVSLVCYDLLEEHLAEAREFADERHVTNRLTAIQGNSMQMDSIENASLDFVYNIESSFHYDDKQIFFNEVARILKPGGVFVYADLSCEDATKVTFKSGNFFSSKQELETLMSGAGLTVEEHLDIAPEVYIPLKQYKEYFDQEMTSVSSRLRKARVVKYWDLVLNNYIKLFNQGLMGYEVYKLTR